MARAEGAAQPCAHAQPADPGLGVYVHWPFCLAKCPYCDFNSHVHHGGVDEPRFLSALLAELDWFARQSPGELVRSVFFGGGTPSLMSPQTVAGVIERIGENWGYEEAPEITLEANPTSVEAGRFAGYRGAGVNRVSLGVQSLDDAHLVRLGRQHSAREALAAFDIARAAFERTSFDLIYARPGQSVDDWRSELGQAITLNPGHLSLYQLTIEPGTRYFDLHLAGKLHEPGDELAADLYAATQEMCDAAGLGAYEISNHAHQGAECRHNLIYWQGGRWAGVGPGAHSRLGQAGNARRALATERVPERWLESVEKAGHAVIDDQVLPPGAAADELILMAMRTSAGLDLACYAALGGGIDEARCGQLLRQGLVECTGGGARVRLTPAGRLVANTVIAELVVG